MQPSELIAETRKLFALPDIAMRVNELLDDPNSSSDSIARELQLDTGLAATLMRVANSAFYGLVAKVDTIPKAVTMVGRVALKDLIISVTLIRSFRGIPEDVIRMVDFWDNSLVCGIVARTLARTSRRAQPERMFLAGMLHKIGRLVFFASRLEEYRKVLVKGAQSGRDIAALESEVFGFDYAELGAALLESWHFPPVLGVAVANQLHPMPHAAFPLESAILHVAAEMAESMSPDIHAGTPTNTYLAEFSPETLMPLGLSNDDLIAVMDTSFDQALELIAIVNPRR